MNAAVSIIAKIIQYIMVVHSTLGTLGFVPFLQNFSERGGCISVVSYTARSPNDLISGYIALVDGGVKFIRTVLRWQL